MLESSERRESSPPLVTFGYSDFWEIERMCKYSGFEETEMCERLSVVINLILKLFQLVLKLSRSIIISKTILCLGLIL